MSETVRLLMVEDSPDDARLICRELEKGGFVLEVKRVDSEPEFVAALSEPWDLIISDFQMPGFDGLRAFAVYRESGLDTPFIFVSGALGEDRAVEAMRVGARDYLLKDNLARLTVAVRRELAAAKTRAAQRAAERIAALEQRRLATAVEASGAGIFEHRLPLGSDTYFDPRWVTLLGLSPDDIPEHDGLGAWVLDRLEPDDQPVVRAMYEGFLMGRTDRFDIELRVRHQAGHWLDVAVSAHAVDRDRSGRATHVVGVMLDQTERRRLEAQFRQAQKMEAIGRLAGGVAHDVNNLLSVIMTSGEFALQELEDGHSAREDVREMLAAASRVAALTEQLLAFSRSKPVAPRVVSLNGIVEDMDRLLRRLVGKEVELVTELEPALWNVRIDVGSMEQVIANLAVNARDAMPDGGVLRISTSNVTVPGGARRDSESEVPPGDYVVVRVSDNGTGMDEATRRKIFEPFFTTKAPGKGTGLGLATCYGIVKQAGGQVDVHSILGEGSTFSVYLPRAEGAAEGVTPRTSTPGETLRGVETVLVTEDDEQVRKSIVRVLTGLGYRVIPADSGGQALAECRKDTEIDLLLTDLVLPDMGGSELVERAKTLRPKLRIIRMSGYAPGTVGPGAAGRSDSPILRKPFKPDELGRVLREVLDG